jgi:hypothetical protein
MAKVREASPKTYTRAETWLRLLAEKTKPARLAAQATAVIVVVKPREREKTIADLDM